MPWSSGPAILRGIRSHSTRARCLEASHGVHLGQGSIMGLDPLCDRLLDERGTFVILIDDLSTQARGY